MVAAVLRSVVCGVVRLVLDGCFAALVYTFGLCSSLISFFFGNINTDSKRLESSNFCYDAGVSHCC